MAAAAAATNRAEVAELQAEITRLRSELSACQNAVRRLTARNKDLLQSERTRRRIRPNAAVSCTEKAVFNWGVERIREAQARGKTRADGGVLLLAPHAAKELGIGTNTYMRARDRLAELGVWRKYTVHEVPEWKPDGEREPHVYVVPNEEVIEHPERIGSEPEAPKRNHGGKRTVSVSIPDVCPVKGCGGTSFKVDYQVTCTSCGVTIADESRIIESPEPEPAAPEPAVPAWESAGYTSDPADPGTLDGEELPPPEPLPSSPWYCPESDTRRHEYAKLRNAARQLICVHCTYPLKAGMEQDA